MEQTVVFKHRLGHVLFLIGVFLLMLVATVFNPLSGLTAEAFGTTDIVGLTNQQRNLLGLENLKANTQLTSAAQAKADDMAKQHFFAHTAPDGTMAWDYIKKTSYAYEVAGENLAVTNESAEIVVKSWMNSPSHRENIVNSTYQDIGIGIAQYGDYEGHKNTTVIVALYAKSAGIQVIGAATNPGGSVAILKPNYIGISPAVLGGVALGLILLGLTLEYRHIRKLHHNRLSY